MPSAIITCSVAAAAILRGTRNSQIADSIDKENCGVFQININLLLNYKMLSPNMQLNTVHGASALESRGKYGQTGPRSFE
jgi:hypothetical protein